MKFVLNNYYSTFYNSAMYKNNTVLKQKNYIPRFDTNILWDNDLLVFSNIKWNFVYQRPQHLISRAASSRRVFYFEQPVFDDGTISEFSITQHDNVTIITPYFKNSDDRINILNGQKNILKEILITYKIKNPISWYYDPKAWAFTDELKPELVIYDCIEDHSSHSNPEDEITIYEQELIKKADFVFTSGRSLFELKSKDNDNAFCFPNSIDYYHFNKRNLTEPYEQFMIKNPKIGFFGIIDNRLNLELLNDISELRPEWNFIMLGPVMNLDPDKLPIKNNIFYLGQKSYSDLPSYISHWNAAINPFEINESTKFVNPAKVLEYLSAGKPIVSTSIPDIVYPYKKEGIIRIADTPDEFVTQLEASFNDIQDKEWQRKRHNVLKTTSWDNTWNNIEMLVSSKILDKRIINIDYKIKEGIIL